MLFCEGLLNSSGFEFPYPEKRGGVMPSSTPPPTSMVRLQRETVPPVEAGVAYTTPHPPAPCRGIFIRTGLTVSQLSGPLPQKTNTGPLHVPSLLIIEWAKASAFSSDGNHSPFWSTFGRGCIASARTKGPPSDIEQWFNGREQRLVQRADNLSSACRCSSP